MKYISEVTKSVYDSEKELRKAEKDFLSENQKSSECDCIKKDEKEALNDSKVLSKKQLANNVENADNLLKEANAEYEAAQRQVEDLSTEFLKAVDSLIEPAKKKVKEAQKARYDAIKAFNDSYGAYHVTYTGDKAAAEFKKALSEIDAFDNLFFRNFFSW